MKINKFYIKDNKVILHIRHEKIVTMAMEKICKKLEILCGQIRDITKERDLYIEIIEQCCAAKEDKPKKIKGVK